jgi:hypothetical protein
MEMMIFFLYLIQVPNLMMNAFFSHSQANAEQIFEHIALRYE